MALLDIYQHMVEDIIAEGTAELEARHRKQELIARWNLNDAYNALTDEDIAAHPAFAHLTKSEVSNAITAFSAVLTALGDDVSGQATNLIKLKG